MNLASDYPNNALPGGALIAIAVTMAAVLTFWLIMVYVADNQSGKKTTQPADGGGNRVAHPDVAAEDGHSEAGHVPVGPGQGATA